MNDKLVWAGTLSALLGVFLCAVAGLARVAGYFYFFGYQSTTLFNVGMGLMVFACLLRLEEIARRGRQ